LIPSRKYWVPVTALGSAVLCVVLSALIVASEAGSPQEEFGKKSRYDATQCVVVDEEQMIVKKKKFMAVFAENKCSRPIQALACFQVIKPTMKHPRNGWYCNFQEYKSRSRSMISERAEYGRAKKWAGCNSENESCLRILATIEPAVNANGEDPETVARRIR